MGCVVTEPQLVTQMKEYLVSCCAASGYPAWIALRQVEIESNWNPDAVSPAGAIGVAQVMPTTAAQPGYGCEPFNPRDWRQSLSFLAQYMAQLKQRTGEWSTALLAYNVGFHGDPDSASEAYKMLALYVAKAD